MTQAEQVRDGVRRHLEGFWPDHSHEEFVWTRGPIEERLPGFRARRIAPLRPDDPWVYVSVGAAAEGDGMKFFLLSPRESPRHVETLAMVAHFNADPRHRLSIGRTIDIGRPWMDDAAADHLLVSLPYPYGPALEHCTVGDRHVQLLWLVPITPQEARYASERGLEDLEDLLERSGVDILAHHRASLVCDADRQGWPRSRSAFRRAVPNAAVRAVRTRGNRLPELRGRGRRCCAPLDPSTHRAVRRCCVVS